MELIVFVAVVVAVAWGCFWLLGQLYGLLRRPAIYFPPRLALAMAVSAMIGVFVIGIGGVIAATWIMNLAFSKRDDYSALTCSIAGILISVIASAMTLYASVGLAWQILD